MDMVKIQRLDMEARSYRIHFNGVEWDSYVTLLGVYHDVSCKAVSQRELKAITTLITEDAIRNDMVVDSSEVEYKGKKVFVGRRIKVSRGE